MKNLFKNLFKASALIFLVLILALGTVHFHANDLTLHHDCLACSFINNAVTVAKHSLVLAVFLFVAQRLFTQSVYYASYQFSLERLRAPPR